MSFLAGLGELGALEIEIQVSSFMGPICKYCGQVANEPCFKCSGLWSPLAVKMPGYESPPSHKASLVPLSTWSCLPVALPMHQCAHHLHHLQASWWSFMPASIAGGNGELDTAVKMQ